jgi:O-antigen ligase
VTFFYLLIWVMPMMRHEIWSGFMGPLTGVKYLGAGAFTYALLYLAGRRARPRFFDTWAARWSVAFAIMAMASYAALGVPDSFERSPFVSYLSFLVLFFITLVVVDSPARLRGALYAVIGAVMFASLHVLREWQKYGGMSFGFRPGWISGDANYYTMSALLGLPIALSLLRARPTARGRYFCIASFGLILAGITLAASRGGYLGLIAALLVPAWHSRRRIQSFAVVTAVLLPIMLVTPRSPLDRLLHPSAGDRESSDTRTALWSAGLQMFRDHPLVGIGTGNFKPFVGRFIDRDDVYQGIAHNTYLEIATEMGAPGLLAFVAILIGSVRTLERVRRSTQHPDLLLVNRAAEGIEAGLVGYAVAAFFVSAQYQKLFWLFVFLASCLPALATVGAARLASQRRVPPPGPTLGMPLRTSVEGLGTT